MEHDCALYEQFSCNMQLAVPEDSTRFRVGNDRVALEEFLRSCFSSGEEIVIRQTTAPSEIGRDLLSLLMVHEYQYTTTTTEIELVHVPNRS